MNLLQLTAAIEMKTAQANNSICNNSSFNYFFINIFMINVNKNKCFFFVFFFFFVLNKKKGKRKLSNIVFLSPSTDTGILK